MEARGRIIEISDAGNQDGFFTLEELHTKEPLVFYYSRKHCWDARESFNNQRCVEVLGVPVPGDLFYAVITLEACDGDDD